MENVTNAVRKLDLTPSEDESVEKLFESDDSDEEEIKNEVTKEKENNNDENVPPEKNYMVECDEIMTDDDEISENESEMDLFVKNRKRKRSKKKRSKPSCRIGRLPGMHASFERLVVNRPTLTLQLWVLLSRIQTVPFANLTMSSAKLSLTRAASLSK